MKKKGFTLVELLGVLVILIILSVITAPIILNQLKKSKGEVTSATKELFYSAADLYIHERQNQYGYYGNDIYCITLQKLVDDGKLREPIVDSNGKPIALTNFVKATVLGPRKAKFDFVTSCTEVNQTPSIPDEPDVPGGKDVTPPEITLPSNNTLFDNTTVFDSMAGVYAKDDQTPMGDIKITVTGTVSLGVVGTYKLTYKATDNAGNFSTAERIIQIIVRPSYVFSYTGDYQKFTAPYNGSYKIELWGAQGGSHNGGTGGNGAYTAGTITMNAGDTYYVYVGGQGSNSVLNSGGYNGGGYGTAGLISGSPASGGGATDIRYGIDPATQGAWNHATGLRSRIMVAAGGSGSEGYNGQPGGALVGLTYSGTASSQVGAGIGTSGSGSFGAGAGTSKSSGAGGGYYGGGGVVNTLNYNTYGSAERNSFSFTGIKTIRYGGSAFAYKEANKSIFCDNSVFGDPNPSTQKSCYYSSGETYVSGSGSSYISGHAGSIAIKSVTDPSPKVATYSKLEDSYHYSGKKFTETSMIAGNAAMPNTNGVGTMTGNAGNGYAKISFVNGL